MPHRSPLRSGPVRAELDALEPRLLLSADVQVAPLSQGGIGQPATLTQESNSLQQLHVATGVAYAHQQGLTGDGQTVVVIDSGIAYDHPALGGGLGTSYRVVGGWDFTEEQDADPYDDPPAGFHGTHVAGIVASSDPVHTGVAPEVDLVALRVFNDQGRGKLSWLKQSLHWVVDHVHAFEHPITAVNLSIGTDWNALELPDYASLEPELEALRDAGIFVTAAAGNAFDAQQPGLTYPAISPHVVVAASRNPARVSDFSQRHASAFFLPGEDITSTVPDALVDFDGVPGDYYAASGTSMASPYLAGVSVLLRQAMQHAGHTNITVDQLESLLRKTSQSLYDPVTNQHYAAVDLEAALREVAGGSLWHVVGDTLTVGGTGARDFIELQSSDTLRIQDRIVQIPPHVRRILVTGDGRDRFHAHLGPWAAEVNFAGTQATLEFDQLHVDIRGFAEIQVFSANAGTQARFQGTVPDERFTFKPTHSWLMGPHVLNYIRGAGQVTAFADDTTDRALFYDGPGADQFEASARGARLVTPQQSGSAYGFASTGWRAHAGGQDQATLHGTPGDDRVKLTHQFGTLQSPLHLVYAEGVESLTISSQGGHDTAFLFDSGGDDVLWMRPGQHVLQTPQNQQTLWGFSEVMAYASAGHDTVHMLGSPQSDAFTAKATHAWMTTGGSLSYARGFDSMSFDGRGGNDAVRLYDSSAHDRFRLAPQSASVWGPTFEVFVTNAPRIHAISSSGADVAELADSASRDRLYANERGIWLQGEDFVNSLVGFGRVEATSTGALDRLLLSQALAKLMAQEADAWVVEEDDFELVAQGFVYYLT